MLNFAKSSFTGMKLKIPFIKSIAQLKEELGLILMQIRHFRFYMNTREDISH